jgi:hypothetical protein
VDVRNSVLKHPAPDGIAYRRRWANGWEFLGNGADVTVSSCSSQNHSGHGLWIAQKTEGANIQMSVDANNTVPPWAMRADDDLEPWLTNEETIERQVLAMTAGPEPITRYVPQLPPGTSEPSSKGREMF